MNQWLLPVCNLYGSLFWLPMCRWYQD